MTAEGNENDHGGTSKSADVNASVQDGSLEHLPNAIRRAIAITPAAGARERTIDITTVGRRIGRRRRIEIFFYRAMDRTYLCSGPGGPATGWYANLLANPHFTFHLKNGIRADLLARAAVVTDLRERQAVLTDIVADINQPHDPGRIRPTAFDDWVNSRLMRVTFPAQR